MAELYPAIDLLRGRVVRLEQGDYDNEIAYGYDPVDVATSFVDSGAPWVHVVDLDAARDANARNRPIIASIAAAVGDRARIQTGGGVRTVDDAKALADLGIARVVMGSAAVLEPSVVEAVAEVLPVAVGLDHRAGVLAVHGWTEPSDLTVAFALGMFPAASAFVLTDIARDGMLSGPDLAGLDLAVRSTTTPIIASGGISSLDDVRHAAAMGVAGVITGKAVYEGRFTVDQAIQALREAME